LVFALMLPCAAGFWAVLPALQALAVPEAYRGPFALYAGLLIPGLFCLALLNFALNPVFQIRRKTAPVIAAALAGLAANGLGLVLLPGLVGPPGVAMAQTLGLSVATLALALRALTGPERVAMPWRDLAAATLGCAAMTLALWPFREFDPAAALAICLPLGVLVYGVFVWSLDIAGLRRLLAARIGRNPAVRADRA
jgi:O-antigen/teichoic acid export membrane protein